MSVSESILSVVPEKYRRDVTVLSIGAAAAFGWFHFEARIDEAYAAAKKEPTMQEHIQQQDVKLQLLEAQSATTQSNTVAIKSEVDMLVQAMLNRPALPTAPPVPSEKK